MRSIDSWLDRFAYRHPKFGIPHFVNYILLGNIVVYILDLASKNSASALLGLDFGSAVLGLQLWRLVTFIFVPDSSKPIWFVVRLAFTYFLSNTMEREWGTAKLTLFYLCGALLTFLASIVTFFLSGGLSFPITLGSVHDTLFLAFATLFPEEYIRVYFVLPVKAKWLALFYVFIALWDIVGANRAVLPLMLVLALPSLLASWINYAIFFWSDITAFVRRIAGRTKHQTSKQTINFKQAARQAREQKGYIHKCAVCGKTDADFPGEEFRYCSQCNGYYCYCSEHIHNHVHIQ